MADNLSFQLLTHEDLLISSSTVIINSISLFVNCWFRTVWSREKVNFCFIFYFVSRFISNGTNWTIWSGGKLKMSEKIRFSEKKYAHRKSWYIYNEERVLHHSLYIRRAPTGALYHVLLSQGASKRALPTPSPPVLWRLALRRNIKSPYYNCALQTSVDPASV